LAPGRPSPEAQRGVARFCLGRCAATFSGERGERHRRFSGPVAHREGADLSVSANSLPLCAAVPTLENPTVETDSVADDTVLIEPVSVYFPGYNAKKRDFRHFGPVSAFVHRELAYAINVLSAYSRCHVTGN
jgi:hypothetical protein